MLTPAGSLPCMSEDTPPVGLPSLLPLPPSDKSNDGSTASLSAVPAVAVSYFPTGLPLAPGYLELLSERLFSKKRHGFLSQFPRDQGPVPIPL